MLDQLALKYPGMAVSAAITGSASLGLSETLGLPFVQEVVAASRAIAVLAPQTDVAVELGGEDAKILYLSQGMDLRMNEACAGGTGAFIDQMAALLHTDASGLNELAENGQLQPGQLLACIGFGGGLTWGGAIFQYKE